MPQARFASADKLTLNRPYMATSMTQGKDKEAALLCLRAIEIKEKHVGPDHPSLATSLGVRAMLLAKQVGGGVCEDPSPC